MTQDNEPAAHTRAIRRLTVAVWALVVAVLAHAILGLFPGPTMSGLIDGGTPMSPVSMMPDSGFKDLPIEEQIELSSVIIRTVEKIESGDVVSTLAEVMKHKPGVGFYYDVGDELLRYPARPSDGEYRTEGMIRFYVGNPASMAYGISYQDGRVSGSGMPLDKLRELGAASQ